jgi:hypothetical protein
MHLPGASVSQWVCKKAPTCRMHDTLPNSLPSHKPNASPVVWHCLERWPGKWWRSSFAPDALPVLPVRSLFRSLGGTRRRSPSATAAARVVRRTRAGVPSRQGCLDGKAPLWLVFQLELCFPRCVVHWQGERLWHSRRLYQYLQAERGRRRRRLHVPGAEDEDRGAPQQKRDGDSTHTEHSAGASKPREPNKKAPLDSTYNYVSQVVAPREALRRLIA